MPADYRTAAIPEAERALFAFLEKVNCDCASITASDAEAARQAGWSDEAIYDKHHGLRALQFL